MPLLTCSYLWLLSYIYSDHWLYAITNLFIFMVAVIHIFWSLIICHYLPVHIYGCCHTYILITDYMPLLAYSYLWLLSYIYSDHWLYAITNLFIFTVAVIHIFWSLIICHYLPVHIYGSCHTYILITDYMPLLTCSYLWLLSYIYPDHWLYAITYLFIFMVAVIHIFWSLIICHY